MIEASPSTSHMQQNSHSEFTIALQFTIIRRNIVHAITVDTMLNFDGGNNGHGLELVTCKQTFMFKFLREKEFFHVFSDHLNFSILNFALCSPCSPSCRRRKLQQRLRT